MKVHHVIATIAAICVSACSALTETRPQTFQAGGVEIVSRSAEEQMAVFITPDDVERMCLVPAPDAALSFSEGISVGQVGEQGGQSAVALGGRTGIVLLARELFYRACEFSQNYSLSAKEAYDLYILNINTITTIGQAEQILEQAEEDSDDDDN